MGPWPRIYAIGVASAEAEPGGALVFVVHTASGLGILCVSNWQ
jgi:hypothetical protein